VERIDATKIPLESGADKNHRVPPTERRLAKQISVLDIHRSGLVLEKIYYPQIPRAVGHNGVVIQPGEPHQFAGLVFLQRAGQREFCESCVQVVLRGCDGPGIGGETDARIHAQVVGDLSHLSRGIGKKADRGKVDFFPPGYEETFPVWNPLHVIEVSAQRGGGSYGPRRS